MINNKKYSEIFEILRNAEWRIYKNRKKWRLKNRDFTIISSNCIGSFMYYDMGLRFLTPTVNIAIGMDDFVKMVKNLRLYMEQEFQELEGEGEYPAGLLGDIKVNFIHYKTFEEGVNKWKERKARIKWDNIFIVGAEKDGCSYETLCKFEELPYKNKVVFTHIDYPELLSSYYIKGFEKEELGTLTSYKKQLLKRRYMDDFDYVDFLNNTM